MNESFAGAALYHAFILLAMFIWGAILIKRGEL